MLFFILIKDTIVSSFLVLFIFLYVVDPKKIRDGRFHRVKLLRGFEIFSGLTEGGLYEVVALCARRQLKRWEFSIIQGKFGHEFFVISQGII